MHFRIKNAFKIIIETFPAKLKPKQTKSLESFPQEGNDWLTQGLPACDGRGPHARIPREKIFGKSPLRGAVGRAFALRLEEFVVSSLIKEMT